MFLKTLLFSLMFIAGTATAHAHMPLCSCFDNGDNTITCQGGFSDGSSAAGVSMSVKAPDGRVLLKGTMTENSEFTFDKPRGDFLVLFDAGAEHRVRVPGRQITQ